MKPGLLLLTDLENGEEEEDLFLAEQLRDCFDVRVSSVHEAMLRPPAETSVLIRNTWPGESVTDVASYSYETSALRASWRERGVAMYNPWVGRGDMSGKEYIPALYQAGYPVIPTVTSAENLTLLPRAERYIMKPFEGFSSRGVRAVSAEDIRGERPEGTLIQPYVDFIYEASFYFVDDAFQYALFTPDPRERWELAPYEATREDLAFAERFVRWNGLPFGIQRIDACRTKDGSLLLMEVEDDSPYLSLLELPDALRRQMVEAIRTSLKRNLPPLAR